MTLNEIDNLVKESGILEFQADHGRYYNYDDIGDISKNELAGE